MLKASLTPICSNENIEQKVNAIFCTIAPERVKKNAQTNSVEYLANKVIVWLRRNIGQLHSAVTENYQLGEFII
ncbi:hypothetical protein AYI68_g474 [Smittium mucronatum]|uniref:Uncharacterized protein n=1 Tax=Smittium mucronatum TaxID=133383 RepID=A0A1R0H838_9FUNG|nr:hypothetical protein AYI68_g474 [Smittium mucronatum]